jgi:hypothetical protein
MAGLSPLLALLLALGAVSAFETEDALMDYEDASDPRLFFSNFTSGKSDLGGHYWSACRVDVLITLAIRKLRAPKITQGSCLRYW